MDELATELLEVRAAGAQLVAPEVLSRALLQGSDVLKQALGGMAGRLKLQFELEAPMWRLEAANPAAGSKLPCTLRLTLPPGYPGGGGGGYGGAGDFDAEVAAPGSLGREAMKVVSRHAYCRLCEMRSKGAVRGMVDWVQSTELHELAAASFRPRELRGGLVRAFVRYHHVQSTMKRSYMNLWALELGVTALLSAGQPAMLLAIGPEGQLKAFLDRAMKVVHWGPTPSRLVASSSVKPGEMESAPAGAPLTQPGVLEVAEVFPRSVRPGAGYNGRDCVDFPRLAEELGRFHGEAARELQMLAKSAFAHQDGRVEEALDGGWVGYAEAEAQLAPGGVLMQLKGPEATAPGPAEAKPTRRWGRSSPQNGRS
ncbi:unnamed protein product [Effrenium voratum]|nr:unnamed protein product [Effrenium voratum]